ncbi:MAG: OmpH family outer membrane protein [Roseovarius sp.]
MRLPGFGWLILWAALAAVPMGASAQNVGVVQSDVLVLDPDRLFVETQFGQRLNQDYLAQREQLITRNRELEVALEAEEKSLTEMRGEKTPEEFRELADAFDVKVQQIRRDSDRAVRDLELSRERAPVIFMRTVEPVLVELMRDAGGAVIVDVRSVLLRADVIDITSVAIDRIDQRIGQGPQVGSGSTDTPASPEPETTQPAPVE